MKFLRWDIQIGDWKLKLLDSVKIERSVEKLADTASIVLPDRVVGENSFTGEGTSVKNLLKKGDKVVIKLGYNEDLQTEFEGYLQAIKTDSGSLTLECEDALYLFRVKMADKEQKSISVKTLLQQCINQVKTDKGISLKLDCDYNFSYDKFVFSNATAFDVLKKIQEEARPNIYVKGDTLHVHPQYSEIFGEVVYDYSKNIDRNGNDLKFVEKDDRKTLVKVKYTDEKGNRKTIEYGDTGGTVREKRGGTANLESLKLLAKNEYDSCCYDGYEGKITSWLFPYCDAGYKATIKDPDYPKKTGTYYVTAVNIDFSSSGGKRMISLGKKI